jgi:primosomal protein N' (replication factor Y) (superfamily II helicase)
VGTQMVTKGLDFDKVNLVGIFDADRMMHFPDFRSYERSFQLMTQVSGRAGRRQKKGKVVIQTSNVNHPLFNYVIQNNVTGFISEQLTDRQANFYPPFSRLIEITLKHADKKICYEASQKLAEGCRAQLKNVRILGPGEPMVSKIRNEYLMTILIKIGRDQGRLTKIKSVLSNLSGQLVTDKVFRSVRIVFDVDPV